MQSLIRLYHEFGTGSETLKFLRNRAHIITLSILLVLCATASLFYLLAPFASPEPLQIIFLSLSTLSMLYGASFLAAKFTDMSVATAYFSTLWTGLIMLAIICLSRGIPFSDASPLIIAPLCMGFCFLGFRYGLLIGLAFSGAFLTLGLTSLFGYRFPDLIDTDLDVLSQTIIWICCLVFLSTILMSYEWMVSKLLRERGGSNSELYQHYQGELYETVISREHFEDFLASAAQRSINHDGVLLMLSVTTLNASADQLHQCYQHCAPLLRSVDTIARTGQNTISIVIENIDSQEHAAYFTDVLRQHILSLANAEQNFAFSQAAFPEQCDSPQALIRATQPYDSDFKPVNSLSRP